MIREGIIARYYWLRGYIHAIRNPGETYDILADIRACEYCDTQSHLCDEHSEIVNRRMN